MVRMIKRSIIFCVILACCVLFCIFGCLSVHTQNVNAMPFYDLKPKEIVLRAEFSTNYSKSASERKSNIALAVRALNNTFVDVGGEFSFNRTVGPRTEKRGYKTAKIIVNGKFTDGVGGGVCQVSTTLYNAVLLAGLRVTEYHAHSLPVSYVAPSFDAMVNSGSADLRFINDTNNPIIIGATADGEKIKIRIFGESMQAKYIRQSDILEYIEPPKEEVVYDDKLEYPELYEGESKWLEYGKKGYISQGTLIKVLDGKEVERRVIRKDKYLATRGVIIYGKAIPPIEISQDDGLAEILNDKIQE